MTTQRKTIIIVDDSPMILKLARNTLMGAYNVFTMPSGVKLFEFLQKSTAMPDLILLDVMMPEQNGYEVIKTLKAHISTMHIPVIFLTSQSDVKNELEGLSLGAVDYIAKPFSPPLLLKRIEVVMQLEAQKYELKELNNNLYGLVAKKTSTILALQSSILSAIGNLIEFRDAFTGDHIERVQHILKILIDAMFKQHVYIDIMENWDINLLLQSSQLHDIGKVAIRDTILLKPGSLTPEEFAEMKKHTTFGEAVVDKIQLASDESTFLTYSKIMTGMHHEKWDGSGYPYALARHEIPLPGRLMAFADVYDALVSNRPYKKAFTHEEAVKIIADGCGTHFDPAISEVFIAAADHFQQA
ncbi:MAG: response regulator [Desulfovibrio sp.]|jgi:putative two-component system response regulator|nr:response regulator [Desulfovibrio sp.]